MEALTDKQEAFCQEYLVDLNATQAAIRAGYSKSTAASIGHENLTKPEIASRVRDLMFERGERVQINSDWVLKRLVEISNRCMDATPVMLFDRGKGKMVQKGEDEGEPCWEFDANGANKATELIGKHIGFFEEHNKQKKADGPAVFQVVPASQRATPQAAPEE